MLELQQALSEAGTLINPKVPTLTKKKTFLTTSQNSSLSIRTVVDIKQARAVKGREELVKHQDSTVVIILLRFPCFVNGKHSLIMISLGLHH